LDQLCQQSIGQCAAAWVAAAAIGDQIKTGLRQIQVGISIAVVGHAFTGLSMPLHDCTHSGRYLGNMLQPLPDDPFTFVITTGGILHQVGEVAVVQQLRKFFCQIGA